MGAAVRSIQNDAYPIFRDDLRQIIDAIVLARPDTAEAMNILRAAVGLPHSEPQTIRIIPYARIEVAHEHCSE